MPFNNHIDSPEDLVTPYEATRAGFIDIALEKNRKATPFVEEAKALRVAAAKSKTADDLIKRDDIWGALITASGLSDKSQNHLTVEDKKKAVENLIENFLKPAGDLFVDELVYRFLLTRGDTLGGMMRNLAGAIGERKFIRCLLSVLKIGKVDYFWLHEKNMCWVKNSLDDAGIENDIKGICWKNKRGSRTLLMNLTVPFVGKNVDMCLFNLDLKILGSESAMVKKTVSTPQNYIALGELKGGIDPAGADEHWKTANSALERIRTSFAKHERTADTFFVGAAIENAMAKEIYGQLTDGKLSNAANLTNETQVVSLCQWFTGI